MEGQRSCPQQSFYCRPLQRIPVTCNEPSGTGDPKTPRIYFMVVSLLQCCAVHNDGIAMPVWHWLVEPRSISSALTSEGASKRWLSEM